MEVHDLTTTPLPNDIGLSDTTFLAIIITAATMFSVVGFRLSIMLCVLYVSDLLGVEATSITTSSIASTLTTPKTTYGTTTDHWGLSGKETHISGDVCYEYCDWPNQASDGLLRGLQAMVKVMLPLLLVLIVLYICTPAVAAQRNAVVAGHAQEGMAKRVDVSPNATSNSTTDWKRSFDATFKDDKISISEAPTAPP